MSNEMLRRARSAVAEARDTRMEAADLAMVVLCDPEADQATRDEAVEVWRRADADLARAHAQVALRRAAAGELQVVAS